MMTMAQREVIAQAPLLVLAEKALGTFCGPVPDEAAHAAKRCLIDWLGVVIAGAREEPTRLLRAALEKATERCQLQLNRALLDMVVDRLAMMNERLARAG